VRCYAEGYIEREMPQWQVTVLDLNICLMA